MQTLYEGEGVRIETFSMEAEAPTTCEGEASGSFIDVKDPEAGIKSICPIRRQALSRWE